MAPARPVTAQSAQESVAKGIKKTSTYIRRKNRRPRGLQNISDTCYRNAALQALLHLPKFVNWIMQHNGHQQNWPCATQYEDPNQQPVKDTWRNEPGIVDLGEDATGCVPCLFKNLIRGYWGKVLVDPETREPAPLPVDHDDWRPLQQLSRRWYFAIIEDIEDQVQGRLDVNFEPNQLDDMTIEEYEMLRQSIKLDIQNQQMEGQQDSDEYAKRILGGIENTIQGDTPAKRKRKSQYESLFTRKVRTTRTCETCGTVMYDQVLPELGFRVNPLPPGQPDDLATAIDRQKSDTTDMECSNCGRERKVRYDYQTVTAPEYLWVLNDLSALKGKGESYKNRNPIDIPEILDITSHMTYGNDANAEQVRYGLQHIVYHAGSSLTFGHYTAAVTGMPQLGGNRKRLRANEFFCNDSIIDEFTNELMPAVANVANVLTVNPVRISTPEDRKSKNKRTPFNAAYLIYVRIPNGNTSKGTTRVATRAEVPAAGSIADNVKNHPRIRRKPAY